MSGQVPNLSIDALFGLDGRKVVVTGGGTGLGLMMATAFAQNGAEKVYICSRKLKNLESAANTLNSIRPGVCVPLEANLTTAQGCKDLANEISKRESKIDVLVNNSGVSWGSSIDNVDEVKGWDRVFDVNTKSIFYLTVALLPLLRKNASLDRPASVINISSVYGSLPFANMPTAAKGQGAWSYLASKAAASQLTRSLSNRLKPEHINVNAIAPGFFPSSE
jgi:NAD(P)-dependent dehydrogenase (short-subunit alcohol dehydrogenase family)